MDFTYIKMSPEKSEIFRVAMAAGKRVTACKSEEKHGSS
jgi:hypothetical protein